MDELVQQSIALVERHKKDNVPWQLDEPHAQPYHRWDGSRWEAVNPHSVDQQNNDGSLPSSVSLYSWNIDFMLPYPDSRMRAAVKHLETIVRRQDPSLPTIIYFAECLKSDIELITADPWIRNTFDVTDVDGRFWQSGYYGTTTLVDKRLPIASVFRVHYAESRMERDALFVDISPGPLQLVLRFCNTHLESLALNPPFRPAQLALCAEYMRSRFVHGAVVAGDFNAIQDFDKTLHSKNGLEDAYLELGRKEDDAHGHTWGQQAATVQRQRFGTSRMDKVFYRGGLQATSFDLFGAGVEVEDQGEQEQIKRLGFDAPWITDHYGVHAIFRVVPRPPHA